jgi:GTP pyrophosphokinase
MRKLGTSLRSASGSNELAEAIKAGGYANEDDLIAAIGFGKVPVTSLTAAFRKEGEAPADEEEFTRKKKSTSGSKNDHALEVSGDADFLVYMAKCCMPLPGEEIVGFVTRGKGVAVHSRSCPNVRNLLYHPEREIEVQWAPSAEASKAPTSQVDVDMSFNDASGMLASISQAISTEGSDILNCRLRTEPNDTGFAAMTIVVRDKAQLTRILSRLQDLKGMLRVERRGQPGASP